MQCGWCCRAISRKDLVQETRSFIGSRDSTRFVLTKQAVANFGNEAVTQIAQWERDQPQKCTQQPPDSAERHQNTTDCGGSGEIAVWCMKYECGEILSKVGRNKLLGRRSLQRRELDAMRSVSQKDPVHCVITETAHTVEEENVRR